MRSIFVSLTLLVAARAALLPDRVPHDDDPTPVVKKRASTCTPKAGGSSSTNDVPAIESAIAACPSGVIVIPKSTTYYLNTQLSLSGCSGCTIEIEGTLKSSGDYSYWNGMKGIIIVSDITGATITSTTGDGVIDGNGQASWDEFAVDSSLSRPTLVYITGSKNIVIENLKFINPPAGFHSAAGSSTDITYSSLTMTAASSSTNPPKNTDGIDVGPASYVTIKSVTVSNQDDCVAFKSGANYVTVEDITCTNSHGLSVGSLGEGGATWVQNVYVNGATMVNAAKAAGIKLWPGGSDYGTATVSNVTWENVVVDGCQWAFQVQTCYGSTASYCAEYPSAATLTDIVVKGFSGTTSTSYEPDIVSIDCPKDGTCGITLSDFSVKAPDGEAVYLCANTPSDIGVTCTSGASG